LHMPEVREEQGPGPEILVPIPSVNTLAITLDLYGAVGFADLKALRRGELRNFSMVPSSEGGEWGTAFPDRAALIETSAGPLLIVCNAGADAGIAIFDPLTRRKTAHFPAHAGCDTPIVFPSLSLAATVVSGKLKARREGQGLAKSSEPGTALLVMDFTEPGEPQITSFDLGVPTLRVAQAGPREVLVLSGSEALLVDIVTGRVLDRKESPGPPVRAIFAP
ncbi:MAG: hypothetical protein N2322_07050, partial [Terrimicrobiaceae bacterium]|nr:hypothetical protein [Terrimicrobiaceae bacterium]